MASMRRHAQRTYARITGVYVGSGALPVQVANGQSRHAFSEYRAGIKPTLVILAFTLATGIVLAGCVLLAIK